MVAAGVDYAFPPHPNITQLASAGKTFACRYGGPGSTSKQLTPSEAQALTEAGIAIVANAEGAADGLRNGFAAGVSWASQAEVHFAACGMPKGRPIYFSVDFDTTSGDWAALDAAMDGAASVIGRGRVGVYGEYSIIEHLAGNGKARWFWQTYAWSGGRWSAHNHIEQYRNNVILAGATLDLDRAITADFGQWFVRQGVESMSYDRNTAWRLQGYLAGNKTITVPEDDTAGSPPAFTEPNMPQQQWDRIEQAVGQITSPPAVEVDYAKLAAALRPIVSQECEAAVRRVLGSLDS